MIIFSWMFFTRRIIVFTRTKFVLVATSIAVASLMGCETNPSKQDAGVVLGAIVGGIVGNQFGGGNGKTLMTIVGAVAGAWAGSSIGKSMDAEDHHEAAKAMISGYDKPIGDSHREWNRNGRHFESRVHTRNDSRYGSR